ncbi:helix-turn-helix domain-containing protein [Solirubrobacter sp. CPCC 204708]|uniref:Helix-turn-helix domain-containing protein n=1 Tax=Solirubrobacter deserti TaxID=2282478 RepID=A0ABT4RI65_9ACTN|nr:helix-turn-helix domain-containing protein [Solirubrobacter deserti]MBE2318833.1 helix-turn-helix domain-containing protein [Solirubrobacter deserti]MDA0138213.1 helix-turn-helix domain-containing protein [Solirubrobacter deserti]
MTSPARNEAALPDLGALGAMSDAVESGLGLPEVVRAAARALDASLVLIDRSSSVLAVAARSTADERQLMRDAEGVQTHELRVGDVVVGRLRLRPRGGGPSAAILRIATTMIASEVERLRAPDRASEAAQSAFLTALLQRKVTDRGDIIARGSELGADLSEGGAVVVVRAHHFAPADDDWRARVLAAAERAARAGAPGALAAVHDEHVVVLLPTAEDSALRRVADAIARELHASVHGFTFAVGHSRVAQDPVDLYRAGNEALLAANVATGNESDDDVAMLAFEDTGAYRLLLPAMSEDPAELQRFYEETVAPLVAYDDQYETDLVQTLETFLDADGNVAGTAARLFTHRHTVRYRLERVKDLSGLDVASTDGREKLGLGLKAMRVLGIAAPRGPATEAGTAGGRVRREAKDR